MAISLQIRLLQHVINTVTIGKDPSDRPTQPPMMPRKNLLEALPLARTAYTRATRTPVTEAILGICHFRTHYLDIRRSRL